MILPVKAPWKAFVVIVVSGLAGCAVTPPPSSTTPPAGVEGVGMADFRTFEERHQWPTNSSPRDLAIDPAKKYAIVSFVNGPGAELSYLDLESGASRQLELEQPASAFQSAYAVAIHPQGDRFAAGWNGHGAIYDGNDQTIIRKIDHSENQSRVNYNDLTFTPDGQGLVGVTRDVVWWDVESGEKIHVIEDIDGPQRLDISSDGILGAITNKVVVLKKPGTGENICELDGGASAIAFSPDGRQVAFAAQEDHTVRVLRVSGCQETARLSFGATFVPVIVWMSDNEHLATGSDDGRVRFWNAAAGELVHSLQAHDGGLAGLVISKDGQIMITATWGEDVIKSWQAERL